MFYTAKELSFWPKEEFRANTPEDVRIVDGVGVVVEVIGRSRRASYTLTKWRKL